MTGIVNSTGARSGVIGTTVGTPAGGKLTWDLEQVVMDSIVEGEYHVLASAGDVGLTGLDLTITPISTNPKFLISLTINIYAPLVNASANIYDATAAARILTGTATTSLRHALSTGTFGPMNTSTAFEDGLPGVYCTIGKSIMGLYTPPSNPSAARNFKVYVEALDAGGTIYVGRNYASTNDFYNSHSPCFLTVMELSGS